MDFGRHSHRVALAATLWELWGDLLCSIVVCGGIIHEACEAVNYLQTFISLICFSSYSSPLCFMLIQACAIF